MIVFNKLGEMGRLGNQLFQIASILGIADKCGTNAVFNAWEYAKYFNFAPKDTIGHVNFWTFREGCDNYFRPELFELNDNWQLEGYFQSEMYFGHIKEKIQQIFEFSPEVSRFVSKKYQLALKLDPVSMHIRVGDFKQHGWYVGDEYFLDMADAFCNRLVIVFSDDIEYCKKLLGKYENIMYCDDNEVHSLCLMSKCDAHMISNSTFSWWGAWLSGSKYVFYPEWRSGNYPNLDFYPERWNKVSMAHANH